MLFKNWIQKVGENPLPNTKRPKAAIDDLQIFDINLEEEYNTIIDDRKPSFNSFEIAFEIASSLEVKMTQVLYIRAMASMHYPCPRGSSYFGILQKLIIRNHAIRTIVNNASLPLSEVATLENPEKNKRNFDDSEEDDAHPPKKPRDAAMWTAHSRDAGSAAGGSSQPTTMHGTGGTTMRIAAPLHSGAAGGSSQPTMSTMHSAGGMQGSLAETFMKKCRDRIDEGGYLVGESGGWTAKSKRSQICSEPQGVFQVNTFKDLLRSPHVKDDPALITSLKEHQRDVETWLRTAMPAEMTHYLKNKLRDYAHQQDEDTSIKLTPCDNIDRDIINSEFFFDDFNAQECRAIFDHDLMVELLQPYINEDNDAKQLMLDFMHKWDQKGGQGF